MPQFFIDRPIFAWVLAILITLGGIVAIARLPAEAYPAIAPPQGIRIAKASAGFLAAVALRSSAGGPNAAELNNILASRVLDQIQRLPGVGSATQFGSEYAMRIWLDPDKLHAFAMSAAAVLSRVRAQNVQVASGAI